jgi:hypothetical protein
MKRSRFTEEQIIAILREQETGMKTADVCRKHGILPRRAKPIGRSAGPKRNGYRPAKLLREQE